MPLQPQLRGRTPVLLASLAFVAALALTAAASARTAAAPRNTSPPAISGSAHEGQTLIANAGEWDNSPSQFAYQWQRCAANGTSCADIPTATLGKYTLTAADVGHTVRVTVTASNASGRASVSSQTTSVVSAKGTPANTARPSITGRAQVGKELTANTGTWTGAGSFSVQWRRCNPSGVACADIAGATGRTYGVRSVDAGNTLRAVVTATNADGSTSAASDPTSAVTALTGRNKAPTIVFLSLKHVGARVYARFRVCDDSSKSVTITERDTRTRTVPFARLFSVTLRTCSTQSRSWVPAPRFRARGRYRYVVTLRAADRSGALSRLQSRSLVF